LINSCRSVSMDMAGSVESGLLTSVDTGAVLFRCFSKSISSSVCWGGTSNAMVVMGHPVLKLSVDTSYLVADKSK